MAIKLNYNTEQRQGGGIAGFNSSGGITLTNFDTSSIKQRRKQDRWNELEEDKQKSIREAEEAKKKQKNIGLNILSFLQNIPKNSAGIADWAGKGARSYGRDKRQIADATEGNFGNKTGAVIGSVGSDVSNAMLSIPGYIQENIFDTHNAVKTQNLRGEEGVKLLNKAREIEKENPEGANRLREVASQNFVLSDKLERDLALANKGVLGTNIGVAEAAQVAGMVTLDVAQFIPLGQVSKLNKFAPMGLGDDLLRNAPKWTQAVKTGVKYAVGVDEVGMVASTGLNKGFREMFQTSLVRGSLSGSTQGMVDSLSVFDMEDVSAGEKAKLVAQNVALNAVVGTLFDVGIGTVASVGGRTQKMMNEVESKKYINNFKENNPSSLEVGNLAFDSTSLQKATEARYTVNEFAKMEGREVLGETVGLSKEAPEIYNYAKQSFLDPVIEKSQKGEPVSLVEVESAVQKMKEFLATEDIQTMSVSVIDPETRARLDDLKLKIVNGEDITPQDMRIHDNVPIETNRNGVDLKFDDLEGKRVRYTTADGVEVKGTIQENMLKLDSGRDIELTPDVKDRILNNFDIEGVNIDSLDPEVISNQKANIERSVDSQPKPELSQPESPKINNKPKDSISVTLNDEVYFLTGKKKEAYMKLESEYKQDIANIKSGRLNQTELSARLKGEGMVFSAEKRKLLGSLTKLEKSKELKRLGSNFNGKEVLVDGQEGVIASSPSFGKFLVKFADGDERYVKNANIKPKQSAEKLFDELYSSLEVQNRKTYNTEAKFQVDESVDPLIEEARKYKSAEDFKSLAFEKVLKNLRGVETDTIVTVPTENVQIIWKDDFLNAKETAKKSYNPKTAPPVEFIYDIKTGKYQLDDGHNRFVSAQRNGQPIKGEVTKIEGNINDLDEVYKNETGSSLTDIYNKANSKFQTSGSATRTFHPEDEAFMQEFRKYSITESEGADIKMEAIASELAEKYDIKVDKQNNKSLGDAFATILDQEQGKRKNMADTVYKYFDKNEVDVKFVQSITTPKGQKALGVYFDDIITFAQDANNTTPEHEVLHAYFDMFTGVKRKSEVLGQVKKQQGLEGDLEAEEWLADNFVDFVRNKDKSKSLPDQIKTMFVDVWEGIKSLVGNEDKVRALYKDIIAKNRDEIGEMAGNTMFQVQTPETDDFVKQLLGVPKGKTKSVYDNPRLKELQTKAEEFGSKRKKLEREIDEIYQEISATEDALDNHPGKFLHKYVNKKTGELPAVGGDKKGGLWARNGDDLATQLGFEYSEEAQPAYEAWLKLKKIKADLEDKLEISKVGLQMTDIRNTQAIKEMEDIIKSGDVGEDIQYMRPEMVSDDVANQMLIDTGDIDSLPNKEPVKPAVYTTKFQDMAKEVQKDGYVTPEGTNRETSASKQIREQVKKDFGVDIDQNKTTSKKNIDQVDRALKFVAEDRDRAIRVAMGEEEAPEGLLNSAVYGALRTMSKETRDFELAKKLSQSSIGERAGQEIQFYSTLNQYDPVAKIQEIIKSQEARVKETTGKTAKKAVKEGVKEARSIRIKIDKSMMSNVLDRITC